MAKGDKDVYERFEVRTAPSGFPRAYLYGKSSPTVPTVYSASDLKTHIEKGKSRGADREMSEMALEAIRRVPSAPVPILAAG